MMPVATVLQGGIPEFLPQLLGLVGSVILLLMLAALGGILYRHLRGGIEWPDDRDDEDDDTLRQGSPDDEWDYY